MAQLIIWYGNLGFPRDTTAALLAVLVALGVAGLNDWRIVLPLLLGGYFLTSMLLLDIADPRIALVLLIVGTFVCLILLITAVQTRWTHHAPSRMLIAVDAGRSQTGLRLIRYGILLLIVALAWLAGQQFPVPGLPPYLNTPIYALVTLGIVAVVGTQDAFKTGCGIILVLLGLGLFITAFDQSFFVMLSLMVLHLLVALATAFMMSRQDNKKSIVAQQV